MSRTCVASFADPISSASDPFLSAHAALSVTSLTHPGTDQTPTHLSSPSPPTAGIWLPNETLSAIFGYLSPETLAQVALVSRRWHAVAERVLYESIVISEAIPHSFPSRSPKSPSAPISPPSVDPASASAYVPPRTLRCCETLANRPHLSLYVRRLHLRWYTSVSASSHHPTSILLLTQHIMHALLPTLASLASLSLLLPVSSLLSSSDLANLFPSPPPALPALRRLIIGGLGDPSPILLANPHLLHLHLADTDPSAPPLSLPPNALSELRAFRGPIGAAVALLPGRPVQGLALLDTCGTGSRSSGNNSNGGVSSADLARLAHTSAPLRVLDLGGVSVTPPLLRDVSRYLPHVEHLRVRLALRHTLHFALSGIVSPTPPPLPPDLVRSRAVTPILHFPMCAPPEAPRRAHPRPRRVPHPPQARPVAYSCRGWQRHRGGGHGGRGGAPAMRRVGKRMFVPLPNRVPFWN